MAAATWSVIVIDPEGENPPGVVIANATWGELEAHPLQEKDIRARYPDRIILVIQERDGNVYQKPGYNLNKKHAQIVNNPKGG